MTTTMFDDGAYCDHPLDGRQALALYRNDNYDVVVVCKQCGQYESTTGDR